ncbi:Hypothetical predicted protein [Octopus vulgaris]|uniref:Uncharacterized protein n=1 Tax=Octopus vulgaris TaxID=6645 RepID=A0AA36FLH9_OCTVU|nr:Hypothetical predicted protein [Octopus vulgaris]
MRGCGVAVKTVGEKVFDDVDDDGDGDDGDGEEEEEGQQRMEQQTRPNLFFYSYCNLFVGSEPKMHRQSGYLSATFVKIQDIHMPDLSVS